MHGILSYRSYYEYHIEVSRIYICAICLFVYMVDLQLCPESGINVVARLEGLVLLPPIGPLSF